MKRSIVQQGPSTLMVSIPMKWVKKYNLKKGMQVEVEDKGRELTISTQSKLEPKKKKISLLHSNTGYVWRELSAAYVSGYDEIKVEYQDTKTYEFIEQYVLTTFVGFETIEHGKNYCVIKQILKENPDEFEIIMRRILLTLLHASEQFIHILETGKDLSSIFPLERTNNRQTYYLRRILTKEGFVKEDKTTFASVMVYLLEQLMNQYKYCTWAIEKRKSKKAKKIIIEHYKKVHYKMELIYELYFSYSQATFEKIKNKTIRVDSKKEGSLKILDEDPIVINYIMSMIENLNNIAFQIHGINS